ncbi:hypothetical protein Q7P35_004952 [Cladosporium inversicolor]
MTCPFSDAESITSIESTSSSSTMLSSFSDTESITSIESTESVWSTASLISNASSRTSIDSLDSAFLDTDIDAASDMIAGMSSTLDNITSNLSEFQAGLQATGEALHRLSDSTSALLVRMESLAETSEANADALQQSLEASTVTLQRCSEGLQETIGLARETLEITRSIWEDMPGCRERRRAENGGRTRTRFIGRFFGKVFDGVREKVGQLLA